MGARCERALLVHVHNLGVTLYLIEGVALSIPPEERRDNIMRKHDDLRAVQ